MSADGFTLHLIREHGGQATVTVEQAANIVGIGREHAYRLAAEHRFPVVGVTAAGAHRESMRVLIPALVDWMLAGGTRQYDELPSGASASSGAGRQSGRDGQLAWLDAQLAA
jgi:hypothetical protein